MVRLSAPSSEIVFDSTMAHVFMLEQDSPLIPIADSGSYNLYFGWYIGELSQNENLMRMLAGMSLQSLLRQAGPAIRPQPRKYRKPIELFLTQQTQDA